MSCKLRGGGGLFVGDILFFVKAYKDIYGNYRDATPQREKRAQLSICVFVWKLILFAAENIRIACKFLNRNIIATTTILGLFVCYLHPLQNSIAYLQLRIIIKNLSEK